MKTLIAVLSIIVALAGAQLLVWSFGEPTIMTGPSLGDAAGRPGIAENPGPPSPGPSARFAELPVVGEPRTVDFAADATSLEQLTPRERRDQFRDWLLFAAASSAGLSPEQLNQSLYDLPALRHGYMRPVANLEYGEARSCTIGDGHVLVLVPTGDGARRDALIADALDAQRKNLGSEPKVVTVIDYDLDLPAESARLTRRADVEAKVYFGGGSGYHQRTIASREDLTSLLDEVDDLTFATLRGGMLTLGGRKVADHRYRGLGVQDVAAIWQSEDKLHAELTAWEKRLTSAQDDFNAESTRQVEALESKWKGIIAQINARLSTGQARKKSSPLGAGRSPFTGLDDPSLVFPDDMSGGSFADALKRSNRGSSSAWAGERMRTSRRRRSSTRRRSVAARRRTSPR